MASSPHTPGAGAYGSVPAPDNSFLNRGYGSASASRTDLHAPTTGVADFADGAGDHENHVAGEYEEQHLVNNETGIDRSTSTASTAVARDGAISRNNTLKKRASLSRKTSLKRSSSRKSLRAGSIKGVAAGDGIENRDYNSALYTPIPTAGTPTEVLANRFQGKPRSSLGNHHPHLTFN